MTRAAMPVVTGIHVIRGQVVVRRRTNVVAIDVIAIIVKRLVARRETHVANRLPLAATPLRRAALPGRLVADLDRWRR